MCFAEEPCLLSDHIQGLHVSVIKRKLMMMMMMMIASHAASRCGGSQQGRGGSRREALTHECGQLLHRNVQRFRGGLVFKPHRLCVSLNSRLESNKEEADSRVDHSTPSASGAAHCARKRRLV